MRAEIYLRAMTTRLRHLILIAQITLLGVTMPALAMARGDMAWNGTTICLGADQVMILTDAQGLPILDENGAPIIAKMPCLDCVMGALAPQMAADFGLPLPLARAMALPLAHADLTPLARFAGGFGRGPPL